ncbi:MAG: hypothetical protein LKF42_00425 [Streptococcaceae bacterium]|jgi:hypothetical protein|nr:hypothetical protein [Streptococcaceae bacterium]MCH4176197.1 hypothetical protein [Streptococcaceae bacterium]
MAINQNVLDELSHIEEYPENELNEIPKKMYNGFVNDQYVNLVRIGFDVQTIHQQIIKDLSSKNLSIEKLIQNSALSADEKAFIIKSSKYFDNLIPLGIGAAGGPKKKKKKKELDKEATVYIQIVSVVLAAISIIVTTYYGEQNYKILEQELKLETEKFEFEKKIQEKELDLKEKEINQIIEFPEK